LKILPFAKQQNPAKLMVGSGTQTAALGRQSVEKEVEKNIQRCLGWSYTSICLANYPCTVLV